MPYVHKVIYFKVHSPEYNFVVFFVLGHIFRPHLVYTAPPVTPADFPGFPRGPLSPRGPGLPWRPVRNKHSKYE